MMSVQLHLSSLFCFALFYLLVFQLHFAQTFHFILCSNVRGINPFVIIGVAMIFAVGVHSVLPKKLMTFFSRRPQYTGYPPKLTTRTLPCPIKISYKFDFSLSRG